MATPSPTLVNLTVKKVNNFLMKQKQKESFVSEDYVIRLLHRFNNDLFQTGSFLTDEEISNRVSSIINKKIYSDIIHANRFQQDNQFLFRPFEERTQVYDKDSWLQVQPRGELALRRRRSDNVALDRLINVQDYDVSALKNPTPRTNLQPLVDVKN